MWRAGSPHFPLPWVTALYSCAPTTVCSDTSNLNNSCYSLRSERTMHINFIIWRHPHYRISPEWRTFQLWNISRPLKWTRKDRNRQGGGVVMAYKPKSKCLSVVQRSDLDSKCDILWCEVYCKRRNPVFLGVFYRPPSSAVGTNNELSKSVIFWTFVTL